MEQKKNKGSWLHIRWSGARHRMLTLNRPVCPLSTMTIIRLFTSISQRLRMSRGNQLSRNIWAWEIPTITLRLSIKKIYHMFPWRNKHYKKPLCQWTRPISTARSQSNNPASATPNYRTKTAPQSPRALKPLSRLNSKTPRNCNVCSHPRHRTVQGTSCPLPGTAPTTQLLTYWDKLFTTRRST